MLYLKRDDGGEMRIEGYACFFDAWTYSEHGGRELFRPGAFKSFLERGARGAVANWDHSVGSEFASVADRSLSLWEDKYGLCFQAQVAAIPLGPGLVDYVGEGNARCSVQFVKLVCHETKAGTEIGSASIIDVCITTTPKDPQTSCWLSSADPARLPPYVQDLRRQWHVGRDARLAASIARLQARYGNKPAVKPRARRVAQPAMSFEEYAGPPPAGITAKDWQWFADMDAAGRRAMMRGSRRGR